jgi:aspartate-semialdehyde dehydrogenase
MKPGKQGYRVAVVGASSLLGKELLTVLEERSFPISRLVTFEADEEEPDLPIVDLRENYQAAVRAQDVAEAELDFAFVAAHPRFAASPPAFLRAPGGAAGGTPPPAPHCVVIDMAGSEELGEASRKPVRVPFLDRRFPPAGRAESWLYASAHPAVIVISSLLLHLAARFPLKSAVAQLFCPASEVGPRGIEELQKQTVNLLSFQKIPRKVFGAQLAFNLLPRLGRGERGSLAGLEGHLRAELRQYLGQRVPLPALRVVQVPVFYSWALSLYVEAATAVGPEKAAAALQGERLRLQRLSQDAPSQIEVTGSSDILVDGVMPDAEHPAGIWVWAVADNLRLAAVNAVEIAESLGEPARSGMRNGEN